MKFVVPEPSIVATLSRGILINYQMLYVQEVNKKFVGNRMRGNVVVPGFLAEGEHYIAITSAAHTVEVAVCMEAWDGEPSDSAEEWDIKGDAHMWLPTGSVTLDTVDGPGMIDKLEVVSPGESVGVRVYCRGREKLRQSYDDFDIDAVQEWYLVRLWPLRFSQ
jgi:hypothetical protein